MVCPYSVGTAALFLRKKFDAYFPPILAGIFLLGACATPQTPKTVGIDKTRTIAGSAIHPVSEPDPALKRLTPKSTVTPISINPIVLIAAVAINAATTAIVAETSPVNDFPAPGGNIGDEAEAEVMKILLASLEGTSPPNANLTDAARAFQPTEEGDAALIQTARAAGASGLALNVRLNEHTVRPSEVRNVPDNAWIYTLDMSARLSDLQTGEVVAKTSCVKKENLANVPLFKIASLAHAGGDAAAASAAWETYKKDVAAALQSQEDAKNEVVGLGDDGSKLPDDPTETFSTPEQEAAYMDHLARSAALSCAREMSVALIGASGS